MLTVVFVFFKQKTAYEMRISDWSSDVCSSDLIAGIFERIVRTFQRQQMIGIGAGRDRRHHAVQLRIDACMLAKEAAARRVDAVVVGGVFFKVWADPFRIGVAHGVDLVEEDRKSTRLNSSH